MAKETIEALIQGGKASAAPPLGPALGPMGVNIGQVVSAINQKTAAFAGMQVPVKVIVDKATKEFTIEIGTPPASALIKKEAGIEKGSGRPQLDYLADIVIEQAIKIAKMKEDNLLGKDLKSKVKEVCGTCDGMGVMVEGMTGREAVKAINAGKFDKEIKSEAIEVSAEKRAHLEEEKKRLKGEMEKRRVEYEAKAKAIVKEMEGQPAKKIKERMLELKIPEDIFKPLLPADAAPAAAPGAAPAAGGKAAAPAAAGAKK